VYRRSVIFTSYLLLCNSQINTFDLPNTISKRVNESIMTRAKLLSLNALTVQWEKILLQRLRGDGTASPCILLVKHKGGAGVAPRRSTFCERF